MSGFQGDEDSSMSTIKEKTPNISEPSIFSGRTSLGEDGFESFQEMHSLLLCPSQWTALLESPVSLVRNKTDAGNERIILDDDASLNDESFINYNNLNVATDTERNISLPLVQSAMSSIKKEDKKPVQQMSEIIHIESYNEDDGSRLEEIEEIEENDTNPTEKIFDSKSDYDEKRSDDSSFGLNLSHILSQHHTVHTLGLSSEGSCNISETCDSPIRGRDTPSMSSVPPTPSSDCRLSFPSVPSHMTHSRNISETPSLPPYINSSTSSAYHSRNSSLASQITTDWFDSDSHSTDIDSCIVMYNGDLHRSINLQDSKYKFPDFSDSKNRTCLSFGDFRSSLQVPSDGVFMPAPELEDTLCTAGEEDNVNNESFDQKHLASAMKSSEWIKKEMSRARSSMVQVKVSSKTRHVVHFNVKAGDMFIWEFATKRKDIGFGLQFEPTEVATSKLSQDGLETPPPEKKMMAILPTLRVNGYSHPTVGSHTATQNGVYEILFDNSYSRFFAKELYYRITTKPAIPNEHYLDQ